MNPQKAPVCLRCKASGHVRKDCHVSYCTACKRFGHSADNCTDFPAIVFSKNEIPGIVTMPSAMEIAHATETETSTTLQAAQKLTAAENTATLFSAGETLQASTSKTPSEAENKETDKETDMPTETVDAIERTPRTSIAAAEKIQRVTDMTMQFKSPETSNRFALLADIDEDSKIIPPAVIPHQYSTSELEDEPTPEISQFPTLSKENTPEDLITSDNSSDEQTEPPLEQRTERKKTSSLLNPELTPSTATSKKNWGDTEDDETFTTARGSPVKAKPLMSEIVSRRPTRSTSKSSSRQERSITPPKNRPTAYTVETSTRKRPSVIHTPPPGQRTRIYRIDVSG